MEYFKQKLPYILTILVALVLMLTLPFWGLLLAVVLVAGVTIGRAIYKRQK